MVSDKPLEICFYKVKVYLPKKSYLKKYYWNWQNKYLVLNVKEKHHIVLSGIISLYWTD